MKHKQTKIMKWLTELIVIIFKIKPKPHKHNWIKTGSVGAYWDSGHYVTVRCTTCDSTGIRWRGQTKATKRSELCKSLPHEHEWIFEYAGGRKADATKDTPMSHVHSCECGLWAVQHYGETEKIIIENKAIAA